jgi:hypothetical protein
LIVFEFENQFNNFCKKRILSKKKVPAIIINHKKDKIMGSENTARKSHPNKKQPFKIPVNKSNNP